MTASNFDLNGLTEGLGKFSEMLNGPTSVENMPLWLRYVDIRAGDNIYDIAHTGLSVHACVTGVKFVSGELKINEKNLKNLEEDLTESKKYKFTKINKCFINKDSAVKIRYESSERENVFLDINTVNGEFLSYIKNCIDSYGET